ncbi:unnamed protein product, partial [Mesorhabditis spiculigera]
MLVTGPFLTLLYLIVQVHAAKQPNILLILADDLGFNDVDWKDQKLHTPVLRSLAFSKHTVQMENSYVNQLCTPTRSALMTGYYPFRLGTQTGVFLHMEPTGVPLMFPFVPENLRALGYKTYMVGKWHLGYCRKELLPSMRGFDYFYGYYGPQTGYFNHSVDAWRKDLHRVVRGLDLFEEKHPGRSVPDFRQNGVYSTNLFTDRTISLLDAHDPADPFFLYLSFQSVHPPLQVPTVYERNCLAFKKGSARRIYCAMLAAMDEAIGRVVTHLKQTGMYDDTIIIFTSDNGGGVEFGASNYPLRGEKDMLWEGGTRTTTFFHAPAYIQEFAVRKEIFHVIDYHATLLGIAGLDLVSYGDGINQWNYIRTGKAHVRRYQFVYNIADHGSAIRDGDFKLILGNVDKKSQFPMDKVRLFRISVDPGENFDIAHHHPNVVKRLRQKLLDLGKFMRRTVRVPTNLWGNPERMNGTFGTGWCA